MIHSIHFGKQVIHSIHRMSVFLLFKSSYQAFHDFVPLLSYTYRCEAVPLAYAPPSPSHLPTCPVFSYPLRQSARILLIET